MQYSTIPGDEILSLIPHTAPLTQPHIKGGPSNRNHEKTTSNYIASMGTAVSVNRPFTQQKYKKNNLQEMSALLSKNNTMTRS